MVYASYYYLVFGYNITSLTMAHCNTLTCTRLQSSDLQILILLFCVEYFMFATTFAYVIVIALPDSQTAGIVVTLLFSMCMIFNGCVDLTLRLHLQAEQFSVFQPPQALPGFWLFMYRVNPLTYIVSGIAASGLHGRQVQCSQSETNKLNPPEGEICAQYLQLFILETSGQLLNPSATQGCQYCSLKNADQYLASVGISWSERWRNFGIVWAYIAFNTSATYGLYFLFRTKLHCNLGLRGLGKYFNRFRKLVNAS
jgi:ABC-type multidrug transport system permease subunit